jgi:hypothetical protein
MTEIGTRAAAYRRHFRRVNPPRDRLDVLVAENPRCHHAAELTQVEPATLARAGQEANHGKALLVQGNLLWRPDATEGGCSGFRS